MGWREALTAREHMGVFLILSAVITQCSEIFCCIEIAISVFQLWNHKNSVDVEVYFVSVWLSSSSSV